MATLLVAVGALIIAVICRAVLDPRPSPPPETERGHRVRSPIA